MNAFLTPDMKETSVPIIEQVAAREILDSRGNPTVEVEVALIDGTYARAQTRSETLVSAQESLLERHTAAGASLNLGA